MADLIDRAKAIKAIEDMQDCYNGFSSTYDKAQIIGVLEDVPTAERKGHWIYGEDENGIDGYHCDKCGFFVPWDYKHKSINFIEDYNFCPNCGADMRGEQ